MNYTDAASAYAYIADNETPLPRADYRDLMWAEPDDIAWSLRDALTAGLNEHIQDNADIYDAYDTALTLKTGRRPRIYVTVEWEA